jgi:thiol-disulfide isomerase/thioredoxin
MTITTVLVAYTTVVATLALAIALLLRSLPARSLPAWSLPAQPLSARPGTLASLPPSGPDLASPAPPFHARTSTAAWLDTSELIGHRYLLAFLSSGCRGCRAGLPVLIDYAGRLADPQRLVAVIVGERGQGADLEQRLAGLATIVSEPDGGPIAAAYRITAFPSFVLVSEDGTVLATGHSVRDLPQPQPQ